MQFAALTHLPTTTCKLVWRIFLINPTRDDSLQGTVIYEDENEKKEYVYDMLFFLYT